MKKGFTLIELLAVITLIGVISIIGSISVTKLIERSKEKTYEEQIHNIELAAKTWATNNTNLLYESDGFKTFVKVEDLKLEGLLENKQIVDPRNKSELNGCVSITYQSKNKKYNYQYSNDCTYGIGYPKIDVIYLKNENNYIEVSQSNTMLNLSEIIFVDVSTTTENEITLSNPIITKNNSTEPLAEIKPNKVGDTYIIKYTATDSVTNLTTYSSIKLKVVDTTPPNIKLNDIVKNDVVDYQNIEINKIYNYPNLKVEDNSGEEIEVKRTGKVNTGVDGTYQLKYTAIDSSKNTSTYTLNVYVEKKGSIIFDLTASNPDGNNNWYKTPATLTISNLTNNGKPLTIGTDVNCTYQINGGTSQVLSSNTFTVNTNGSTIAAAVECTLVSDSNIFKEKKIALKIDTVAPTCVTSGGSDSWKNANVTIKGTCSDTASGCVKTTVSYTTKVASGSSLNVTNIGPGTNGGTATIYDNAGNSATCLANQTVRIDRIPPKCIVEATNADGTTHNGWTNQNVTVTGTCSDTGGSGCTGSSSQVFRTGYNGTGYAAILASNYTFKDGAGNKVVCEGIPVKIDKTKPVVNELIDVYGYAVLPIFWDAGLINRENSAEVSVETCNNYNCYFYTDLNITDSGGSGIKRKLQTFETDGVGGDYIPNFTTWSGSTFWGSNWLNSTRVVKVEDNAGNVSDAFTIYYRHTIDDLTCKLSGTTMKYYYDDGSYIYSRDVSGIKCGK